MSKTTKHILTFLTIFTGLVMGVNAVDVGQVRAHYQAFRSGYTGECGVTSGDKHDYAGLIVRTRIRRPDGSFDGAWGGTSRVRVRTAGISVSDGRNVVRTRTATGDGKGDVEERRGGVDFATERDHNYDSAPDGSKNCHVGGEPFVHMSGIVLGHGRTSEGRGKRNWKLDCDYSLRGPGGPNEDLIDFQLFRVSGQGVPQGARAGGSWSGPVNIRPVNGETTRLTLTYHEPEQWDLQPGMRDGSAKDRGTVHPGQSYTFRAFVRNGEPNKSPSQADVQMYASTGKNYINPGSRQRNWEDIGELEARESLSFPRGFTVKSSAPDGQLICFWTRVNRYRRENNREDNWRPSPDNYPGISGRQTRCVTVRYEWNLRARMRDGSGRGSAVDGGVVTGGNRYEFRAETFNSGPDRSPPNTVSGFSDTFMELHTSEGASAITSSSRDNRWNVGPVFPRDSETRNHQFQTLNDPKYDGELVCFYTQAEPQNRGGGWTYSPDNYPPQNPGRSGRQTRCVRVQYPYTIEGELDAPEGGDGYLEPGETHTVKAIYLNDDVGDTRTGFDNNVTNLNINWRVVSSSRPVNEILEFMDGSNDYSYSGDPVQATSDGWTHVRTRNVDGGESHTLSGKFRVKNSAQPDDRVCFQGFYSPSKYRPPGSPFDTFETPVTDATCIKVDIQRKPYLTTSEGDVHAGAETCSEPYLHVPGTSKHQPFQVTGRTKGNKGSKATYVTSASGPVDNFGSNDKPDDDQLTFGNEPSLGNYGLICHVDPYASNQSKVTGSAPATLNSGNINSLNGIRQRSGNLRVQGGILNVNSNTSLTVLVSGDVYINSNVKYTSGGYQVDQMPGLAIVASGNIYIDPGVTRLDGIYYTNGIFNTCKNSFSGNQNIPDITSDGAAGNCDNQLEVNGSVLANEFQFRRTVDDVNNSSPKPAFEVNLLPQHLIAPPPGFSGAFESNIRYLGERPPAF